MAENLSNDFDTTLTGAIDNVVTALAVASSTGAPAPNFRIRIDDELMLVTSIGTGLNWTVTRGVEGTAAASHAAGATLTHIVTTEGLYNYIGSILKTVNGAPLVGVGNIATVAGADTNVQFNDGGVLAGSASLTWNKTTSLLSANGDLTIAGAARRIRGDFSNGTVADRTLFQTSTVDGITAVGIMPNGTGPNGSLNVFNKSDPDNSSYGGIAAVPAEIRVVSAAVGTGVVLPLTFIVNAVERMRIDTTGNLTISTVGARIRGDFTNATVSNRVIFQSSTVDGYSGVYVMPNGTSKIAAFNAFNNSDPDNAAYAGLTILDTDVRLASSKIGSGAYIPMTFYTSGAERMRIDINGNVGIGYTPVNQRGVLQVAPGGIAGGTPLTSGGTDPNQFAFLGNANVGLRFGLYSTGGCWIQHSLIGNYASNADIVLQPNGGAVGIGTVPYASTKLTVTSATGNGPASFQGPAGTLLVDYQGTGINYIDGAETHFRPQGGATDTFVIIPGVAVVVKEPIYFGYGAGSGGTVTQTVNKANPVTLNRPTGVITTHAASLAAGDTVSFVLNNSVFTAGDILLVSVSAAQQYSVRATVTFSGSASIYLTNNTAGALATAVGIYFAVIATSGT